MGRVTCTENMVNLGVMADIGVKVTAYKMLEVMLAQTGRK